MTENAVSGLGSPAGDDPECKPGIIGHGLVLGEAPDRCLPVRAQPCPLTNLSKHSSALTPPHDRAAGPNSGNPAVFPWLAWQTDRGLRLLLTRSNLEAVTLSTTLDALEQVGFEVRDVEPLREHYALTLRAWVNNLRGSWQDAQRLVPPSRALTWLLYLAAGALAFEHGNLTIDQVLAVRQGEHGASSLPFTREQWLNTAP
jgi:hypothetical protein